METARFRLSAAQLKWFALFCMVLDHLAYFFSLPIVLRWVGRLAAPIFLYLVVEGFCRTHNLRRYLLRMYAVAVTMGIANALLARYAGVLRADGLTPGNSICSTFFLLLLFLWGIRSIEEGKKLPGILLLAGPFAVSFLAMQLLPQSAAGLLLTTVLPCPFFCEGGLQLLCLGVLLYAFRSTKKAQFLVFLFYSLGCNVLLLLGEGRGLTFFLFTYYQWMEVFALVPLWYYSGERGRCPRGFFYLFYPAHIYLLWVLSTLVK